MQLNVNLIQNGLILTIAASNQPPNSFFVPSKEDALKAIEEIFKGIEQKPNISVVPDGEDKGRS